MISKGPTDGGARLLYDAKHHTDPSVQKPCYRTGFSGHLVTLGRPGGSQVRLGRGTLIIRRTSFFEVRMFGGIGPEKILLLAVVVLLLFGAKRIPEIGSSFGKGIREFKKSFEDGGNDASTTRGDLRAPAPQRDVETQASAESKETEWQPRRLGS
jgi:sec-independent protein translocase protein TatA